MPIGFARVEFVKRSEMKTAVGKAAYNARERIAFEGNCVLAPRVFDYSYRASPVYHDILVPKGVHENFQISEVLWNAAEAKEVKINSQVAIDLVLALPDDESITLEDRIKLVRSFVSEQLISKGLGAQIDIHSPQKKVVFEKDCEIFGIKKGDKGVIQSEREGLTTVSLENGKEIFFNATKYSSYKLKEHNWHAHVLATTRRFKEDGSGLEDRKPRELLPQVRKGRVVSGLDWGKLWTLHQNALFKEKGMALRVDSNGIVPQEHLGPVRMRGKALDLFERRDAIESLNKVVSQSPKEILDKVTERLSVFTKDDVDRFFEKHVQFENYQTLKDLFWSQSSIQNLFDKNTGVITQKYSTTEVIEEEKSIIRISDRIGQKVSLLSNRKSDFRLFASNLNHEQKNAFDGVIHGSRLSCIQGYAGTGKSYLLASLAQAYQSEGFQVRGLGPDNATCAVLKEKGISNSENVIRFLYATKHGKRMIRSDKELWIVDEAGKLGNKPLLELLKFAESKKAQVVLSGDFNQLPSIGRGGMFKEFNQRYDSYVLENIQRQEDSLHREAAVNLSKHNISDAIDLLSASGSFKWSSTREESFEGLISMWSDSTVSGKDEKVLMLAHTNDEVKVLNEMARSIKRGRGELSDREYLVETPLGRVFVSSGDLIEFRKNDKELGVTNGLSGTILSVDENRISVQIDRSEKRKHIISFSTKEYRSFQLGYASTYFRSQGATVDKAFVLHSPHINKELFYVAMTRHTKEAKYCLSRDEVSDLSKLKVLASRASEKENTLSHITQTELKEIASSEVNRGKEVSREGVDSLERLKEVGISAWVKMKSVFHKGRNYIKDKKHDSDFYKPALEKEVSTSNTFELARTPENSLTEVGAHSILSQKNSILNLEMIKSQLNDPLTSSVANKILQKDASLEDKMKLGVLLFYFGARTEGEHNKKISETKTHSDQEKLEWSRLKSAIDLTKDGKWKSDSIAFQEKLFEAKHGVKPTQGQSKEIERVLSMFFEVGENRSEKEMDFFTKNIVCADLIQKSLEGKKVESIDVEKSIIQLDFMKEKLQVIEKECLEASKEKNLEKSMGHSIDINF